MSFWSNKVYWKISFTLLFLLLVLGIGYLAITAYTERQYTMEANQRLYGSIAQNTVKEVKPLVNGEVDTAAIQHIMHSMMVINPNVEVYLLDTLGGIITYVAPYKKIKLDQVDLSPVQLFIQGNTDQPFICGDDPRNPGNKKVFSAAAIEEEGKLLGYIYIILASEEQAAVTSSIYRSRMFKLSGNLFFLTLLGAMLIGMLAIGYITRHLNSIIQTVKRFKEGDYGARIPKDKQGDFPVLGDTFNQMADRIVANIDQLKSVENLRRELIANVSHDLRTPLAIMQGYIETMMMKNEQLSPEDRQHYLDIVLSSSQKLSHLVSQLFEYSKLEAKQIEPNKEPFFIAELMQDVFSKYQILAEKKDIVIDLQMEKDLPLVFADISLVERVIQNLMDNAIKFTPEGGTVIIALQADHQQVEVKIADTGPGISEQEQSYIFERYRQNTQTTTTSKDKGAGLGLAIAKKIMEIHNSTIRVISKPNEGAAFLFSLPVHG